ncbi:MAG TPA: FG-GAP-like repeat-containing protein [Anaerolineae bacterium]|nr:FG-GAP-like repeat-containing protein [Anaerolineae bacterium]
MVTRRALLGFVLLMVGLLLLPMMGWGDASASGIKEDSKIVKRAMGILAAPVATDGDYTTPEDTPVTGNVISEDTGYGIDSDVDGDPLPDATVVTPPITGTLVLSADGSFDYTPPLNYNGVVTFAYELAAADLVAHYPLDDNAASTNVEEVFNNLDGTMTSNTNGLSVPGIAGTALDFNATNYINLPIVPALTTDLTEYTVLFWVKDFTTATLNRAFTWHNSGPSRKLIYLPNGNEITHFDNTYVASAGHTWTAGTWYQIAVTQDGSRLVRLYKDGVYTSSQGVVSLSVPDVNATSIQIGAEAGGNRFTGEMDDVQVYNQVLSDSQIAWLYSNPGSSLGGGLSSNTAVVTVTVTAVNDAPIATDGDYTTPEDTPVTGNVISEDTGYGIDSDVEGDPLAVYTYTLPVTGTLMLNPDGSFTYTPPANWFGTVTYTYQISDGNSFAVSTGVYSPTPFNTFGSGNSRNMDVGDVDGDGDLDVVIANVSGQAEEVWLNDGTGNFGLTAYDTFGAEDSTDIQLGDMDGDGDLDAVVVNFNGTQANGVWLNDGTGNFGVAAFHSFGASGNSTGVALGDLDGDGDLDVAISRFFNQSHEIWMNDGTGNLGAVADQTFGGGRTWGVTMGDVDGDGDLDVVTAGGDGSPQEVWLNDGTGDVGTVAYDSFNTGTKNTTELELGDMDGDGDLDAVLSHASSGTNEVWLNDGTGDFGAAAFYTFGAFVNTEDLDLGDVDGDGDLDVVVANSANLNEIWLNDGTGALGATAFDSFGGASNATMDVIFADLTGDGHLEIVAAHNGGAQEVWASQTALVAATSNTAVITITVTPVNDNPVATNNYYLLEVGTVVTGSAVMDDAGFGVDYDPDTPVRKGTALDLDGGNDYIDTNTQMFSDTDCDQPYTIEAWVNTSDASGVIMAQWGASNQFALRLIGGNLVWQKGGVSVATSAATVNDGSWHHVAGVRDGAGNVSLYIDGAVDGTGTDSTCFAASNTLIGTQLPSFDALAAQIEEIHVWDFARSGTDIADTRRGMWSGGEPGLVLYYPLNDGAGSTATNLTGDTNGTLVGMAADDWVDSTAPIGWTAAVVTPPIMGTLIFTPDGGFHYTPPPAMGGVVSFTYTLDDQVTSFGPSAEATVWLNFGVPTAVTMGTAAAATGGTNSYVWWLVVLLLAVTVVAVGVRGWQAVVRGGR